MPVALLLALAASLGIHAAALFLPEIELSSLLEAPPLPVEIVALPLPVAAPVVSAAPPLAKPAGKLRHKAAKEVPKVASPILALTNPTAATAQVAPLAVAQSPTGVAAAEPGGEAGALSAAPVAGAAAAPAPAPASQQAIIGRIRFILYKGEQGMAVGQVVHQWQVGDGRYQLTGTLETTGLAALFKPIKIVQESRGRVDAGGLHPEQFVVHRNGKVSGERADFDLAAGTVSVAGRPPQPAGAAAQDLLSFHYQLGLLSPNGRLEMGVATGKKFDQIHFELLGTETLQTPAGSFATRHYRAAGDTTTEVWVAVERSGVPVKIRYIDRNGDSFDEVAAELTIDTVSESTKAP